MELKHLQAFSKKILLVNFYPSHHVIEKDGLVHDLLQLSVFQVVADHHLQHLYLYLISAQKLVTGTSVTDLRATASKKNSLGGDKGPAFLPLLKCFFAHFLLDFQKCI